MEKALPNRNCTHHTAVPQRVVTRAHTTRKLVLVYRDSLGCLISTRPLSHELTYHSTVPQHPSRSTFSRPFHGSFSTLTLHCSPSPSWPLLVCTASSPQSLSPDHYNVEDRSTAKMPPIPSHSVFASTCPPNSALSGSSSISHIPLQSSLEATRLKGLCASCVQLPDDGSMPAPHYCPP